MPTASATNTAAEHVKVKSDQKCEKFDPVPASDLKMTSKVDIIDIRHDAVELSLKDEIMKDLDPQEGPRRMPTLLLYDERGLQLFEEVHRSNQTQHFD